MAYIWKRSEFAITLEEEPIECDMHWRDKRYFIPAGDTVVERLSDSFVACVPCALHFNWIQDTDGNKGYWGPDTRVQS